MTEVAKQDVLLLFTQHFRRWVGLQCPHKKNNNKMLIDEKKAIFIDYSFKVREGNQT